MDPVRELPYWPAAMALLIEAGQMTASDYVPITPIYCLHPKGRPQIPFFQKAMRWPPIACLSRPRTNLTDDGCMH